jgi:putative heme-binding domain-containing protein
MRPIASTPRGRHFVPFLISILASVAIAGPAQDDASSESPLVRVLKRAPEARRGTIVETFGKRGTPADLEYLFGQALLPDAWPAPVRLKALDALAEAAFTRKARPSGDLARIGSLIQADPSLRQAAIRLAGIWKVKEAEGPLRGIAESPKTSDPDRAAALEAMAEIGGDASTRSIKALTAPDRPPAMRALAVAALARLDVDAAAEAAAAVLGQAAPGQDFVPMIAPFLNRQGGPDKLASAISRANIPADPAKLALRAVYALGRADESLIAALSKAAKLSTDVKPPDKAEVDRLMAEVAAHGDAARGERVFRRPDLNCIKCHAVAGAAGGVGPELSSVGASSPVDYLINSIMVPDQAIKEEFVTKVVQTADGRVYHGIVADKDDKRIILREATGELRVIPADEIEDSKDGGSLMPKGLSNFMTRAEFVDLLRFLSELGKPGPYAIHSTTSPTIQRWRLLKPVPPDLAKSVPDEATFRKEVLGAEPGRWLPVYASVPGMLDVDELTATAGSPVVYVQGEVNVTAEGPIKFVLDQHAGVDMWINDGVIARGATLIAERNVGVHKLTLRVDSAARKGLPIKVEVSKPEGSSAEFTVVGGR